MKPPPVPPEGSAWTSLKAELAARRQRLLLRFGGGGEKLDAKEEANFLRQLSLMIEAGIPFMEALTVLQTSMQGRASAFAGQLSDALYRGHSLSRAFAMNRERLSEVAAPLVEAGEACGGLTRTLQVAADWAELTADLKARMRAAMTYPIFVLLINIFLAGVMLGYVFPAFIPLFAGEALPLLTRFFLMLSTLASSKLFWLVAVLLAVEGAAFLSQPESLVKLHRWALLVPVLGPLLRSAARTRFCAVLAVTTRTGLPLMKAMALAAKASGDPEIADLDEVLQREVRGGGPLDKHFLDHSRVYGLMLSHGISLCQATGETDVVCGHLTKLFQAETEWRVEQLQALAEPLLIAMVSLTTATLLLAIYWPLGRFLQTLVA